MITNLSMSSSIHLGLDIFKMAYEIPQDLVENSELSYKSCKWSRRSPGPTATTIRKEGGLCKTYNKMGMPLTLS